LIKAKQVDPAHPSLPQLTLPEIYLRKGQLQKAIQELEELKSQHPDSDVAEMAEQALEKARGAVAHHDPAVAAAR
jgi:outer membrane protein assembly factor BamD (BamD/ComL family)